MKLELKHIKHYLDHNLKILYSGSKRKMNGGSGSSKYWIGITATIQRQGDLCKPILRSLSDLTKEIEINGYTFIPIERLVRKEIAGNIEIVDIHQYQDGGCMTYKKRGFFYTLYYDTLNEFVLCKHKETDKPLDHTIALKAQSPLFELLREWHFDLDNLIENNLAVNINTLNKQTNERL